MNEATAPSLPNLPNPGGIPYFGDMSPSRAARVLMGPGRSHAKGKASKGGKGKPKPAARAGAKTGGKK